MTKEKGFYVSFFRMYILLVLQNVITLSVNLADNMMLGAYSETALSGVAAVNQIQFIYQQVLMAFGDGCVIFCSRFWGKKEMEPMKKIAACSMHCGLCVAVILFLVVSLFPYGTLRLFTDDMPIIEAGVSYLHIIRFTYLFFAVSVLLLATLRSVEVVKIAFVMSVITFCINCGINYVLIYGKFGAPQMGVRGAAIGTLVARVVECIVLIIYVLCKETHLRLRIRDYLAFDKKLTADYLKLVSPMVLVHGLWGANTALQTVILGHMTAAAIAANSVASTMYLMVKSMAVGASSTASVHIGKAIGQGDLNKVREYSVTMQKLFLLIGAAGGLILFLIRIPILELYQLSAATKEMANTFLIILSVVFVGMSYQMPTNNGIIRGGGDAMYVVKMDLISIWGIVIPLSLLMAFVVEAPPVIVVCCLNADQVFKCIPAYLKSNHGNWIRKITRDED